MHFKAVTINTVLQAKDRMTDGYLQKPWNVHASLLLFLYTDSIRALFVYSANARLSKSRKEL